jgi:hypothetical protein
MSRSGLSRFVGFALALVSCIGFLASTGGADDKGKGKGKGRRVGQEQIVHGYIGSVTDAKGTGTVTFIHKKWGGTVKVDTATTDLTKKTVILVCDKSKTLTELKTLVDDGLKKGIRYTGIARVNNRKELIASKIIVCNDSADDDDDDKDDD